MKNYLTLAAAVIATIAMTSCGKSSDKTTTADGVEIEQIENTRNLVALDTAEAENLGDSLGYLKGLTQGLQMAVQISDFEEAMGRKFEPKAFEEGFRSVVACDSADLSYVIGVQVGLQTFNEIMLLRGADIDVNRYKLAAQLLKGLNTANPDQEEISNLMVEYQKIYAPLQTKIMDFQTKKFEEAQRKAMQRRAAAVKDTTNTQN